MQRKDEKKSTNIARATYALVERSGLSGLTMADIAKAAGIATGTLYLYHRSKEELINRLYEQARTAADRRLLAGIDPAASYRSRFRQMWVNLVRNRVEHFQEALLVEQVANSPRFREQSRVLSSPLTAYWLAFLEEGKAQEALKDVATPLLCAVTVGSAREVANLVRGNAMAFDAAAIGAAFSLCWDGVKA